MLTQIIYHGKLIYYLIIAPLYIYITVIVEGIFELKHPTQLLIRKECENFS